MSEPKTIADFVEMLGLLHDIGKLTDEFLRLQSADNRSLPAASRFRYYYQMVVDPATIVSVPGATGGAVDKLKTLRANAAIAGAHYPYGVANLAPALGEWSATAPDGQTYTLAEGIDIAHPGYFKKVTPAAWQQATGKAMQPAHIVAIMHGIAHYEKEAPSPDDGAIVSQPYAQTYLGAPFGDEAHIAVGTDDGLSARYRKLAEALAIADRTKRLAALRELLSAGIGDTQRPTNEVTLWDWGYTTASLAKAALYWITQHNWPGDLADIPIQTLAVTVNRLEQYSNADKITDLTGLRLTLDEAYAQVQRIIEEELGLGNRFYHDETGAYFLVAAGELTEALSARIRACFPADLQPQIYVGTSVKLSEIDSGDAETSSVAIRHLLAQVRTKALQKKLVYFDDGNTATLGGTWEIDDARPHNAERCSVCGQRPVGYPHKDHAAEPGLKLPKWADSEKAIRRNVCRVCLARRGRSAEQWAKGGHQRTIWTDDAADDNGRLALFVGELDLQGWLEGGLVSTLVVSRPHDKKDPVQKNPSPARLYRMAETARAFWEETVAHLDDADVVGQRAHRLALYPPTDDLERLNDSKHLGSYHAYELDVDGVMLAVMWDGKRFITAENLAYFVKRWKPDEKADKEDGGLSRLQARLEGNEFRIMEPTGYGEASFVRTTTTVERTDPLGAFTPAISLLAEPSLCMVLVPADKALTLAQKIRARYAAQMGRVRDRLPLNIGLVFFPRRTPIRSVLDAGRRMLAMGGEWRWEQWTVSEAKHETTETKLTFQNGVSWHIPTKAGDGVTKDQWYPYFLKAKPADAGSEVAFTDLVHVNDLKPGDTVWVRPSRFDYEFLDSTARTYDIHYDAATGKRSVRPTRPYRLDDLDTLEGMWGELLHLQRTQRYQVVQTIESTWEGWNTNGEDRQQSGVFKQFVTDTLAGAAWPQGQWRKILEEGHDKCLIDAGVSGVLADVVELHMQILKEPEPKKNGAPAAK
jgi:hypothetical protein